MRRDPSALRLVQVSDCHLSADPATGYRGQSADANLKRLLPAIRGWQPEYILLSGDVAEDASAAAYGRVSAMLNSTGAPVLALPGNHDCAETMRRYFPRGPWHGPFAREVRGWQLVLLDSTEPGRIGGALAAEDISAMEGLLGASKARFSLIALHHQPVAVNSYWIDRYALARPEPFLEALDRQSGVRCVTWGHVHQDFSSERNGVRLLGAPSSVCNSLPERERFTPDLSGPACRWISLGADGSVETGLLRAQSSAGRTSQRMR